MYPRPFWYLPRRGQMRVWSIPWNPTRQGATYNISELEIESTKQKTKKGLWCCRYPSVLGIVRIDQKIRVCKMHTGSKWLASVNVAPRLVLGINRWSSCTFMFHVRPLRHYTWQHFPSHLEKAWVYATRTWMLRRSSYMTYIRNWHDPSWPPRSRWRMFFYIRLWIYDVWGTSRRSPPEICSQYSMFQT